MKKLLVLSVLLGLMALPMAFADVNIGGDVQFFANADQNDDLLVPGDGLDPAANMGKVRIRVDAAVDDYNTVKWEYRNDGLADLSNMGNMFKFIYLQSDISGALGVDAVGITARFGLFEEWHSLWNAGTSWHRARVVTDDNWTLGGGAVGGAALDFDLGMVVLKTYVEFGNGAFGPGDFLDGYKFAIASEDTLLDGLSFIAGYAGYADSDVYKGYIHADAGYTLDLGDLSLTIPVSILYSLEREAFEYGTGVKVGYGMFGVNVGLGTGENGDASEDFLEVLDAEVMVSPIEDATIYAKVYNRLADGYIGFPTVVVVEDKGFQAVDIGAKYAVGAMTFYLGYVYAADDAFQTVVCEDDSTGRHGVTGSAFYLGANLSF